MRRMRIGHFVRWGSMFIAGVVAGKRADSTSRVKAAARLTLSALQRRSLRLLPRREALNQRVVEWREFDEPETDVPLLLAHAVLGDFEVAQFERDSEYVVFMQIDPAIVEAFERFVVDWLRGDHADSADRNVVQWQRFSFWSACQAADEGLGARQREAEELAPLQAQQAHWHRHGECRWRCASWCTPSLLCGKL